MENIPFSFSNEEHAGIHFVCFVSEFLLLLLTNIGDNFQDRMLDTSVFYIARQQARKTDTFQCVIASGISCEGKHAWQGGHYWNCASQSMYQYLINFYFLIVPSMHNNVVGVKLCIISNKLSSSILETWITHSCLH